MYANVTMFVGCPAVVTPHGVTAYGSLAAALRAAREAISGSPDRWPTAREIAPPTAGNPLKRDDSSPAKRASRKPRRKARTFHRATVPTAPTLPADRSRKPDCAPAGKVWRASGPDGRCTTEHASRATARERCGAALALAGQPIRIRCALVVSKAYRAATQDRTVRPKRTKIERSSKVRRQRGQRETRVLRAAANRR